MADAGMFDAAELGLIGSAVLFAYGFGKLANGVLADRVNTRKFMATGLFVSAVINLILGFSTAFSVFLVLWAANGWFQSFGAASSVVTITHWYDGRARGTFYGIWASSHNIGEAITFIGTAVVVSMFGWMWGFRVAGLICVVVSIFIWRFLYERPEVFGLPSAIREADSTSHHSVSQKQWAVFKSPAVWILGLASASFYVTRYAINSWGVFFLEAEKGYSPIMAGQILAANAVAGIFATFFSGILSDKFFNGRRNWPALLFGIIFCDRHGMVRVGASQPLCGYCRDDPVWARGGRTHGLPRWPDGGRHLLQGRLRRRIGRNWRRELYRGGCAGHHQRQIDQRRSDYRGWQDDL
jgi:OPA family sugar phosphate sensor protein UhpC-like MFS transporter